MKIPLGEKDLPSPRGGMVLFLFQRKPKPSPNFFLTEFRTQREVQWFLGGGTSPQGAYVAGDTAQMLLCPMPSPTLAKIEHQAGYKPPTCHLTKSSWQPQAGPTMGAQAPQVSRCVGE